MAVSGVPLALDIPHFIYLLCHYFLKAEKQFMKTSHWLCALQVILRDVINE
uniref:Uncharacterized protein n=1 Tax=Anguilla anguilla TaxID=7936 RepID=A0A0E9RCQ0_ANGAN